MWSTFHRGWDREEISRDFTHLSSCSYCFSNHRIVITSSQILFWAPAVWVMLEEAQKHICDAVIMGKLSMCLREITSHAGTRCHTAVTLFAAVAKQIYCNYKYVCWSNSVCRILTLQLFCVISLRYQTLAICFFFLAAVHGFFCCMFVDAKVNSCGLTSIFTILKWFEIIIKMLFIYFVIIDCSC